MSISETFITQGKNMMKAAELSKKALGPIDSVCGGARGLSGTDIQAGCGFLAIGFGKLLRWIGL